MEDTDLSGGVRVQLAQADALIERGHRVTIVTRGLPLTWRSSRAEWIYAGSFTEVDAAEFDFVVGTWWPTVKPAFEIAGDRALHLCQGYEGSFSYYQDQLRQIEETYRLPIPKLVVAKSLEVILAKFTTDVVYVGQIVEDEFFRSSEPGENEPLRVLLAGAYQVDIKGIDAGYGAITHARWRGESFQLVRVSPWAPSQEEPLTEHVNEFHVALSAAEMTNLVHSCDIFLGPNRKEEGFGLVAAEAMAAGLPAVLTRIPSYLSFDERQDYALWGDPDDPAELGDKLVELIADAELRQQLRRRGRQVAEQFRSGETARRMEEYLLRRRDKLAASR